METVVSPLVETRRRAGIEQSLIELRWRRAASDPLWFFENCVWIPSQRDPRGREPFILYDYQHEDLNTFLTNRFVAVLKCRQIGLSTLVGAYALWLCLFRPGSVVLWVSDSLENANKAVGMLNVMWTYLPDWVKDRAPRLTGDQAGRKEWTFADGMTSRIRAFAGTKKAGASETASLVVLDEFALAEDQDNLYRSTDPTTDAGGSLWVISTARGGHNRFARMFRAAQRGMSKFVDVFHPWMVSRFVNPRADQLADCTACGGHGYHDTADEGRVWCSECVDPATYYVKAREFVETPWLFSAEYPSDPEEAFRESGRPRFTALPREDDPSVQHDWLRGEVVYDNDGHLRLDLDDDGPLRVHPDHATGGRSTRRYVAFVDPATGGGGDATAVQVMCYDDDGLPERVAWWHSNEIEPVDVARRVDRLGRWFAGSDRAALLAVENTGGWGDSMLLELSEYLRYPSLYAHRPTGHARRPKANKLGFPMHHAQRPMVIDRLAGYVSTMVPDGPLLGGIDPMLRFELSTFVRRADGKVAADTGCHDDLVTSTAGCLWLLLEERAATDRPNGEGVATEERAGERLALDGMWRQIEEARMVEQARDERAARRMQRANERQARRSPVTLGGRGRRAAAGRR